ncbi:MAG: hypothetical protein H7061_12900 [Bdellovibrionaceae bacterium]|nr:hypothetical protein [Bdellovibrio sp.]
MKFVLKSFLLSILFFSFQTIAQVFIPFGYWGGAQVFSLAASTLTISSNSLWIGDVVSITLFYRGRTGQVIPWGGHVVTVSATGAGTSSGTISAVTDNGNGTYTATLTGATIGTTKNLTATVDGATLTSSLPTFIVTGRDCSALLTAGFVTSAIYTVDVDGGGGATASFNVFCDQTNDGGGWMLAAIPRRASPKFAEPSGLVDPTVAGPQRNANIWSMTNTTVLFKKIRFTNAASGAAKTNIATWAVNQTFNGLFTTYATYSQSNVILTGAAITSNIGSTCFIIRGKSGAFAPYSDSADWLLMGFHVTCATPLAAGDRWDDDSGNAGAAGAKEWVVGGKDDGDGALAPSAVGINTAKVDWDFSAGGSIIDTTTIVWVK